MIKKNKRALKGVALGSTSELSRKRKTNSPRVILAASFVLYARRGYIRIVNTQSNSAPIYPPP